MSCEKGEIFLWWWNIFDLMRYVSVKKVTKWDCWQILENVLSFYVRYKWEPLQWIYMELFRFYNSVSTSWQSWEKDDVWAVLSIFWIWTDKVSYNSLIQKRLNLLKWEDIFHHLLETFWAKPIQSKKCKVCKNLVIFYTIKQNRCGAKAKFNSYMRIGILFLIREIVDIHL